MSELDRIEVATEWPSTVTGRPPAGNHWYAEREVFVAVLERAEMDASGRIEDRFGPLQRRFFKGQARQWMQSMSEDPLSLRWWLGMVGAPVDAGQRAICRRHGLVPEGG